MRKIIISLALLLFSNLANAKDYNLDVDIDRIAMLEIRFFFTLTGEDFKIIKKQIIDERLIIENQKEIIEISKNLKFEEKLKYNDSLFKRKPDIVLNFYDTEKILVYTVGVYEIKGKLDYILYADFKADNFFYRGLNQDLTNLLIKYYKTVSE